MLLFYAIFGSKAYLSPEKTLLREFRLQNVKTSNLLFLRVMPIVGPLLKPYIVHPIKQNVYKDIFLSSRIT